MDCLQGCHEHKKESIHILVLAIDLIGDVGREELHFRYVKLDVGTGIVYYKACLVYEL